MGNALSWQLHGVVPGASEPHWLGGEGRHLYASLHRAAGPDECRLGVLLVPPLFHEQPRSRRLLMEVAGGLAALGLPSMRFDFYGTGDSAGDSGEVDFASMATDLELATGALRAETGVDRIAVVAWRAAALPVARWLQSGGRPQLVVLWEPVLDGAAWLKQLDQEDARERCSPDRYRVVRRAASRSDDDQLMGVAVSQRLRGDIAGGRLAGTGALGRSRCWGVMRPAGEQPDLALERVFALPPDSPTFGGSTRMDAGLFVTPQLKRIADDLGRALLEAG